MTIILVWKQLLCPGHWKLHVEVIYYKLKKQPKHLVALKGLIVSQNLVLNVLKPSSKYVMEGLPESLLG